MVFQIPDYVIIFLLPRLTNAKEVRTWNLFATLQFLSEQVWSPTTFASGLTEMTRQQKHKLSGLTTHSFFYVKKKKNRVTSSVLLNVAFVCNFAYLNYIMNFLKVNVRDLAKAKYEDTYLLTTNKLYHVFQSTNRLCF